MIPMLYEREEGREGKGMKGTDLHVKKQVTYSSSSPYLSNTFLVSDH